MTITVVNMIPKALSGETGQYSQPHLAMNPNNPLRMVATASASNPSGGANTPSYISSDGGKTWALGGTAPDDTIALNTSRTSDAAGAVSAAVGVNLDATNSGWRTSWDLIAVGDFIGIAADPYTGTRQRILLYDRSGGEADVVGFGNAGKTNMDIPNARWRTTWDMMIAGSFIGNGRPQVLLYDRAAGQGDVIGFDLAELVLPTHGDPFYIRGKVNLDTANSGWRSSWDLIVAGNFIGNGRQQVLLYDRAGGAADVVGFDGNGKSNLDTTNNGWRSSWDLIVAGNFVGNGRRQILLYDRAAGQADVVGFDGNGRTNLDTTNSGWRSSWDLIVVGEFIGNGKDQILLYDSAGGTGDVVGFDANGNTNLDTSNSGWRSTWNPIVAGNFIGNGRQQILLYDRGAGQADVVGFDANGNTNLDTTIGGWRTSWDLIVAGGFIGNSQQQIVLYDRAAGQAGVVGFISIGGQSAASIQPVIHSSGRVYAAYFRWKSLSAPSIYTADVVVCRDNNWAQGANPYTALVDPGDKAAGVRVAQDVATSRPTAGQERMDSHLSLAVDPNNRESVFLAWVDYPNSEPPHTIHLRHSTDGGQTWSADLRAIVNGVNPALAVNAKGDAALLYRTLTGGNTWETQVEISRDGFTTASGSPVALAKIPSNAAAATFPADPRDYHYLAAAGNNFYGVFCANNTPDNANFPHGVTFQRNANFTTHQLLNVDNTTPVAISINPFFFEIN